MKKLFLFILGAVLLLADPSYPESFSSLGTPLYQASDLFSKLPKNQQYSFAVDTYQKSQKQALELSKTRDKKAYLKVLRALSKEHDKIISMIKREMINALRNDEYNYFLSLSNAGIDTLYQQESFKTQVYDYYLANREKSESPYLEERIRLEKGYQKLYGIDISSNASTSSTSTSRHKRQEKAILLSRPGCGYCVKAKNFMKAEGIRFTEYNIHTSNKGKALYKKHQGSGVPLIIIGDEVIRGYSKSAILGAL